MNFKRTGAGRQLRKDTAILDLFKRRRPAVNPPPDHFDVPGTVYAVGDIHGMPDLLDGLVEQILADATEQETVGPNTLIFMGDYVDRGPDSRGVLRILTELEPSPGNEIVFLLGNHEAIMLDFVSDPLTYRQWLDWGGIQTLASFDVAPVMASSAEEELERAAAELKEALGEYRTFLQTATVMKHRIGNVLFCHAGMIPDVPYEEQPDDRLLWGSRRFMERGGIPGYWTVHGHTIVDEPGFIDNRIAIDTGAYASNVLTAARITSDGCTFMQQS